jgi:cyclophilin family peptidyl-prolyl cis-trans isomerase
MRILVLAALIALAPAAGAQSKPLAHTDSGLIRRILLAEDRRDSTDAALVEGARHSDARVRSRALRARARIIDPHFAARNSLPSLATPRAWPEPAWRLRYRSLTPTTDCALLNAALADSAWAVRLRAADLLTASCAGRGSINATLESWTDALPADASRRPAGGVSWHAAAHALVALARMHRAETGDRLERLATHHQWQVRMYAAHAAALLSDTTRLRILARDANDNVKATAIELFAKLTGHTDDTIFVAALFADGAQAVRAAALALEGSPRADARSAANAAFERWVARANAPARDARVALLQAAGRPASDDRPPVARADVPVEAVALALGADRTLLVTMAQSSGGGSFVVRLRGDVAPITSARILALVRAHYYDGLTWHRVEPDFVIQGGSPGASEYVGFPRFFRDELGTVPHVRGTLGMSTRGHDTGDAQWFINLKDNLRLGNDYTVFGDVIDGIDVVDGILEGDSIETITELHTWRR